MTAPRMFDAVRQAITARAQTDALRAAAPDLPGCAVLLLSGHAHLETALKPYCYNLGNFKAPSKYGRDFCVFSCGEEVLWTTADAMRANTPDQITFRGAPYTRGGKRMQSIMVHPPHEWSRFEAYATLAEGAQGYVDNMRRPKWADAWAALFRGDALCYASALLAGGYYTADATVYRDLLIKRVDLVRGLLLDRPTLREGSTGPAVEEWQRVVVAKVDGSFGPQTAASTRLWQRSRGLVADGVVGPETWARALPRVEVVS